ncbi:MAG: hypothetical protein OXF89_10575 [Rhodospirillaceae bacterium]|nr:hypothetical protein [Rhodospirillaceae bacterium]
MKSAAWAVFLGLSLVLLPFAGSALAWRYDYKPPIVGTVIVYENDWIEVLLSRRGDWETWCNVQHGERSFNEGDFEIWQLGANAFDGRPVAFVEELTKAEILRTYWPLTPGKTASSAALLLHPIYPTRYSETMKVVAHLPAARLASHRADAVLVEMRYNYERESIFGIRMLYLTYYVPRWQVWLPRSWQFVSGDGAVSRIGATLKDIYVPGIVGKPIPIPQECHDPVG